MSYRLRRSIRNLRPELIRELFYEHKLDIIPVIESRIPVELSLLDEKNISRISEVKKTSLNTLKERLGNGDKCFVTEESGRLASYHWVQSRGEHYVQQTGKLEKIMKGEAVIYHVRVHNDFKGHRINSHVYSKILEYCKDRGYSRVWIYTNRNNISNRKGLENLGFKPFKQTLSVKFKSNYYLLGSKHFKL